MYVCAGMCVGVCGEWVCSCVYECGYVFMGMCARVVWVCVCVSVVAWVWVCVVVCVHACMNSLAHSNQLLSPVVMYILLSHSGSFMHVQIWVRAGHGEQRAVFQYLYT